MLRTRFAVLLVAVTLAADSAAAQDQFRASLDGGQNVPPVATSAGGWATATLHSDSTLSYRLESWNLAGTAAHLHLGAAGATGALIASLSGGPARWYGVTAPLSSAEIAALRAGNSYFDVESAAHPSGEIRGQLRPAPANFAASLDGSQPQMPTGSTATAIGSFLVNPDHSIRYEMQVTGLSATSAHIHIGQPRHSGPILFLLTPGPTFWSGTTPPMSEADYERLQAGGMYVNIHTFAFPFGEISGQIFGVGDAYGSGCPSAAATDCRLDSIGAPMTGRSIRLRVSGGEPGGRGFLGMSRTPAADFVRGCPRLLGLPLSSMLPLTLDGAGMATRVLLLPPIVADLDAYFQFGGLSGGALSYSSNAWALRVEVL